MSARECFTPSVLCSRECTVQLTRQLVPPFAELRDFIRNSKPPNSERTGKHTDGKIGSFMREDLRHLLLHRVQTRFFQREDAHHSFLQSAHRQNVSTYVELFKRYRKCASLRHCTQSDLRLMKGHTQIFDEDRKLVVYLATSFRRIRCDGSNVYQLNNGSVSPAEVVPCDNKRACSNEQTTSRYD
jgi:hypothetical protein